MNSPQVYGSKKECQNTEAKCRVVRKCISNPVDINSPQECFRVQPLLSCCKHTTLVDSLRGEENLT